MNVYGSAKTLHSVGQHSSLLPTLQVGTGIVAVRMRLKGAPESLYCVGRSCIRWQLVPVPDGLGEERITEGLTALSFLIKAIFASSPAFVGLDILVAVYIN